jgi:hypothetical protein
MKTEEYIRSVEAFEMWMDLAQNAEKKLDRTQK